MNIDFPVSFTKMSGTGNDFVIIDHRSPIIALPDQPEFARRVCRRMVGVGADGLILIESCSDADFSWRFYNADGSVAEMCGNGGRCAARFAHLHGIAGRKVRFRTLAGVIAAEVEDDTVRLRMTDPHDYRPASPINLDNDTVEVFHLNTGVPHAVIFVDQLDIPVKPLGKTVRHHPLFQPAGANANFVKIINSHQIQVRTYERGVEDETLACGTGCVASAILSGLHRGVHSPVEVLTAGGETLTISFDLLDGPIVKNVFLEGPARTIYTGSLTAESLL